MLWLQWFAFFNAGHGCFPVDMGHGHVPLRKSTGGSAMVLSLVVLQCTHWPLVLHLESAGWWMEHVSSPMPHWSAWHGWVAFKVTSVTLCHPRKHLLLVLWVSILYQTIFVCQSTTPVSGTIPAVPGGGFVKVHTTVALLINTIDFCLDLNLSVPCLPLDGSHPSLLASVLWGMAYVIGIVSFTTKLKGLLIKWSLGCE